MRIGSYGTSADLCRLQQTITLCDDSSVSCRQARSAGRRFNRCPKVVQAALLQACATTHDSSFATLLQECTRFPDSSLATLLQENTRLPDSHYAVLLQACEDCNKAGATQGRFICSRCPASTPAAWLHADCLPVGLRAKKRRGLPFAWVCRSCSHPLTGPAPDQPSGSRKRTLLSLILI